MTQMARNVTMVDLGFLGDGHYLIHDRDGKYCPAFDRTIEAVGVKSIKLPARSPNLNSFAERWVRSAKNECFSKLILFGEVSLRRALTQFEAHFHEERPLVGSRTGARNSRSGVTGLCPFGCKVGSYSVRSSRFQSPPHQTAHADFPHSAFLTASHHGL